MSQSEHTINKNKISPLIEAGLPHIPLLGPSWVLEIDQFECPESVVCFNIYLVLLKVESTGLDRR
jgi:hypothetical protein